MDIWVIRVLLLDVVQATRVWFQDGCVMEHLVESDAQKDHVELEEKKQTDFYGGKEKGKRERQRRMGTKPVCFPLLVHSF